MRSAVWTSRTLPFLTDTNYWSSSICPFRSVFSYTKNSVSYAHPVRAGQPRSGAGPGACGRQPRPRALLAAAGAWSWSRRVWQLQQSLAGALHLCDVGKPPAALAPCRGRACVCNISLHAAHGHSRLSPRSGSLFFMNRKRFPQTASSDSESQTWPPCQAAGSADAGQRCSTIRVWTHQATAPCHVDTTWQTKRDHLSRDTC